MRLRQSLVQVQTTRRAEAVILGLSIRRTRILKWYFSLVDEAQRLRGVVLESLDQEQDAKGWPATLIEAALSFTGCSGR